MSNTKMLVFVLLDDTVVLGELMIMVVFVPFVVFDVVVITVVLEVVFLLDPSKGEGDDEFVPLEVSGLYDMLPYAKTFTI